MFSLPFLLSRGFDGIAVFVTLFWVWVLIDCVTKESSEGNDRIVWLLIILFAPVIGALVYYFVRRPERIKALGQ